MLKIKKLIGINPRNPASLTKAERQRREVKSWNLKTGTWSENNLSEFFSKLSPLKYFLRHVHFKLNHHRKWSPNRVKLRCARRPMLHGSTIASMQLSGKKNTKRPNALVSKLPRPRSTLTLALTYNLTFCAYRLLLFLGSSIAFSFKMPERRLPARRPQPASRRVRRWRQRGIRWGRGRS